MTIKKAINSTVLSLLLLFMVRLSTLGASFDFSPSNGVLYTSCPNRVNIQVDATGEVSNAADIEITYDTSKIEILDSNSSAPGIQIGTGDAYQAYFGNEVDSSSGTIKLAGASFANDLTSKKTFGYIEFQSRPGFSGNATFEITFTGAGDTLDSNVAETTTSDDLLDKVTNGSYSFSAPPFGSCVSDTTAPAISFIDPLPLSVNVRDTADITIKISDAMTGIDLNTIVILINGESYTAYSPEVRVTGSPNEYTLVINPRNPLYPASYNTVIVNVTDIAGNHGTAQTIFNQPPAPTVPPTARPTYTALPTTTPIPTLTPIISIVPQVCPVCPECNLETLINKIGASGVEKGVCENRLVQTITEKTVEQAPTVNKIVSSGILFTGLLSYLMFLNTPGLLFSMIGFIFEKKQKNPWGVIMDAGSHKPVEMALCKLFLSGTTNMIDQTISDKNGVYGFTITHGSYRLEVSKSGYETSVTKFSVEEDEQGYVHDINLIPSELKAIAKSEDNSGSKLSYLIGQLFKKIYPILYIIGLITSIISVVVSPILINIAIICGYILVGVLSILYKADLKPKYSAVIDHTTNLRIPNALVKVFNIESGKLIDTKLTNQQGFFDYWDEPGEYALNVAAKGYSFPSEIQSEYDKAVVKGTVMLKVKLSKGKNKLQILLDPIEK